MGALYAYEAHKEQSCRIVGTRIDFSHCRTPTSDFEESLLLSLYKARRKSYTLSPMKRIHCLIQIILRAIIPFLVGDEKKGKAQRDTCTPQLGGRTTVRVFTPSCVLYI